MQRRRQFLYVLLTIFCTLFLALPAPAKAPKLDDEGQIHAVFDDQVQSWNQGEIDKFMSGYWKSERTTFVGASGIKRGWQAILDNYKQRYPDKSAMGKLNFSNLEINLVDKKAAYATGEFHLQREGGNVAGYFSLYLRKFGGDWRIVLDHTTVCPSKKD